MMGTLQNSSPAGSITGKSCDPREVASAPQFPLTSFKKLEYHSPLEGESERSSRMAKADPVGGSHKASQRRDLVRRRGQAPAKLMAKADAVGGTAPAPPIRCGVSPAGRRVGPPPDRRRASPMGRRVGPPPDRRQTAPSLRLPLKGGVITGLHKASCPIPGQDGNHVPLMIANVLARC